MENDKLAEKIMVELKNNYSRVPKLFLNYKTSSQMLCAIILSAQSTDTQVNTVTKELFKKYKTSYDFANAKLHEFEQEIFSTGFYKNKTKNVINCFKKIEKEFGGKLPQTMEELVTLPGVGRKTANLVLLSLGKIEGIAVDTHVLRLSNRFGFSKTKNANKVEQDLMKLYKKKNWGLINKLFISHGRALCTAKKPDCKNCFLKKKNLCKQIDVVNPK
jgi:endonuclease III